MSFQIKDFTSIVASMVNVMRGVQKTITDFYVGSVVRTMLEAVAVELEELYQQAFIGLKEAIPVSVYTSFRFALLGNTTAAGTVRVIITAQSVPVVIGAGTVFTPSIGSLTYTATDDTTIATGGSYADVPVVASATGSAGNLAAGVSFTLSPAPVGFASASTLTAIASGQDSETDAARLLRFQSYISSLARSTVAALNYGLSTVSLSDSNGNLIERVALSYIDEPYVRDSSQPIANVAFYIHNGVGSTSDALLTQANKVIAGYVDSNGNNVAGYKAAGVPVTGYKATETTVAVTATVTILASYLNTANDPRAAISAAISAYILGLGIGASCLKSEIYLLAMSIPGVVNFVPSAPSADVIASLGVKLMPGTITLTAA